MKLGLSLILFFSICFSASAQSAQQKLRYPQPDSLQLNKLPAIAPDLYTKNFSFFCRKELQLEKTTKIPFRFRLGSLNYCNYLEGKNKVVGTP